MGKLIIQKSGGGGLDPDELTAKPEDVLKGKIAGVAGSDEPTAGTLQLTGTAADSQVLNGQTYYNTDAKTKRAGTMPNRGAWTGRIGINGSVTVPAGYHNGAGYVDQSVTNRGAWTGSVPMNGRVTVPEGYHSGGGYVNGPAVTQRGAWATSIGVNGRVTIPEGYHSGSGYVNQSIATSGGWTVTPQTSAQSCGIAGHYMTSDMTVAGVPLPPANAIKKGYRYWIGNNYVDGTFEGAADNLWYLYNNGTWGGLQQTGLTGATSNASIEYQVGAIRLAFTGMVTQNSIALFRFNQSVNVSSSSYVNIKFNCVSKAYGEIFLGVSTNSGVTSKDNLSSLVTILSSTSGTLKANVSSLSGNYFIYIGLRVARDSSIPSIQIPEIYLSNS